MRCAAWKVLDDGRDSLRVGTARRSFLVLVYMNSGQHNGWVGILGTGVPGVTDGLGGHRLAPGLQRAGLGGTDG